MPEKPPTFQFPEPGCPVCGKSMPCSLHSYELEMTTQENKIKETFRKEIFKIDSETFDMADFVLHFNDGGIYTDFLRRKLG